MFRTKYCNSGHFYITVRNICYSKIAKGEVSMLKIILMDDDAFTCSMLSEIIGNLIQKNEWDAAIVCQASSPKEIVTFIEKNRAEYQCH